MFRQMHNTDRSLMAMDLAEKMAERRSQSLAAGQGPTIGARLARMLFAPAAATGSPRVEGSA